MNELLSPEALSALLQVIMIDLVLAGDNAIVIGLAAAGVPRKTFAQAAWQIVIADVSMSLDNVLAVAGAALEHPVVLVFGLVLSIALMGVAASFIARLLQRHRWIAYVGLLIILYVAIEMIWEGSHEYFGEPAAALLGWGSSIG
jgi:predicted tellurium resistance membrane protein TerC